MRQYYVYILGSRSRTLYVGVTNNLAVRLAQHREGGQSFSAKYRVNRLLYWESTANPYAAITREKQIKGYRREKKQALIASVNPAWNDLSRALGI